MNKSHRSIWNSKTNSWVAVSEKTSSRGKKSSSNFSSLLHSTAVIIGSLAVSPLAYAQTCTGVLDSSNGFSDVGPYFLASCSDGSISGIDTSSFPNKTHTLHLNNSGGSMAITGNLTFSNAGEVFSINKSSSTNNLSTNTPVVPNPIINMGAGNDMVMLKSENPFDMNAEIQLGSGNDEMEISDFATVNKNISAGTGNDKISFLGSSADITVNSNIDLGDGDDIIEFNVANTSVFGDINGGAGSDSFRLSYGTARKINGGSGIDFFTLRGTFDFSNSGLILDGGADEDNLSFHDITGSVIAENMRNFESFNVGGFSSLNFTGSQLQIQNSTDPNSYNTIGIDQGSSLSFSSNSFTIAGGKGLSNRGVLNLRGSAPGKILTINANYEGGINSSILLNAKLGNDSTPIDKLIVKGNTSGKSKIFINNVDGTGAATTNGINVVQVLGNSNAVFTLGAAVQVGNFEYFLFKSGKNWFLESIDSTNPDDCVGCEPTPTPTPTPTPSPSPSPTPSPSPLPQIYRPAVSGYVLAAPAQFDQTASLIGTYEQRQANPAINGDIWGRVHTLQTRLNTNTFGYEHTSHNIQFGKIIKSTVGQEFNSQTGLTAVIGQQSADYFDEKRLFTANGKYTGQSSTNSLSLGAYYSQTIQDKPYLDLQAYVSSHNTQFNDVNGGQAKQNGLSFAMSAELGKTYALSTSGLEITPQAQLIFQTVSNNGFKDTISEVAQQTAESLRVRAGVTLQSSKAKANTSTSKTNWNASLNLWQEVLDTPSRVISGYVVSPEKTQKPWIEIGIGVNQQLSEASSLSAQISHQNSLSGNERKANSINLSYQFKW